ncbi:hypothetical protein HLB23_32655 [Nocardia uniformis]|uniref:Uncharacterized protein n=1 Tax=Nocardia uniformis TaxID=53432 RepID=A0A849CE70_9NOCA|nr:hypothetical protein [Nocardia uniformis]NNH74547.1 hypothetical protein [Nocardia uniformis]
MTKPVNMRLPDDLVDAAKQIAQREGITVTAFVTRAIEAELLRQEFTDHAAMVTAAESNDAGRLAEKSVAIRKGLAHWKRTRSSGAA